VACLLAWMEWAEWAEWTSKSRPTIAFSGMIVSVRRVVWISARPFFLLD